MLLGECGQNDKRAKLVLLGCWLGWFLNFADRSLLSPLLPLIKDEMNLGYLGIGFLTTAFFIGYTITPVPGGVGLMTVAALMYNTLLASKNEIYKYK